MEEEIEKGFNNVINELYEENERLKEENERLKAKIKSLTSKSTSKKIYGEYKHVRLTDKEYQTLIETYGEDLTKQLITYLDEYIEMKGYKAKNHYLCIRKWVLDAVKQNKYKNNYNKSKEVIPEWMDKKIESEPASPEAIAELEEMLKEYR